MTTATKNIETGYKQTELGVIPEDWEVKYLGDIADLLTGHPFPSSKYTSEGIRLLRGSNVKRGNTDWSSDITMYWPRVTGELQKYILQDGDVVIAMDGSLVGKSFAQLSEQDLPALLLQRVTRIRSNHVDINYLKHQIVNPSFTRYLDSVKTASAIPHISPTDIREYQIPLPPKSEQTAIATALSDMDALIAAQEQLIAKKRAIKQGAMQELLEAKEGWEEKKLGDICSNITTGKLDANAMRINGEYRFYTCARNFYRIDKYAFDDEALLISGNGENVGYVHYYKGKFNAYQRTYVLTGFKENIFFLKVYLDRFLPDRIDAEVNLGNTPYIKMDTLTDMKIKLPQTAEEQTRIAQILSDMDAEIEQLGVELAKLRGVKKGMMEELLTGAKRLSH